MRIFDSRLNPRRKKGAAATNITVASVQATTSGTAFNFTGLATGLNRITMIFNEVSLSGTDDFIVQIGDSGGLETTGYVSTSARLAGGGNAFASSTAGFIIRMDGATEIFSGSMVLHRVSGNIWIANYSGKTTTTVTVFGGGSKTLSAELDRITLTRTGTDTFDAGSVNVFSEK